MSNGEVTGSSTERLRSLTEKGGIAIGYLYPHAPLELLLAHGLTPSLMRVSSIASAGFEDSLQTFSCAFSRNIFSQRAKGGFADLSGFLFPGNTCDALQNVGDVWKQRFPSDRALRLTYPVSRYSDSAVTFLAEEMRFLSKEIERLYGKSFSPAEYADAVALVGDFKEAAQFLYAARVVNPRIISYSELSELVMHFLVAPLQEVMADADEKMTIARSALEESNQLPLAEQVRKGLLVGDVSDISLKPTEGSPRLLVVGGMVDPMNLAELFNTLGNESEETLALDLLSLGFKSIFSPPIDPKNEPYTAIASSILRAPLEPTQEGLIDRATFVGQILGSLAMDGLVVCEQSFCDPDEFETPTLLRAAEKMGILSLRLPMDPEISDRNRIEGRLQTFLETLREET